jgi:hypothetical protein
MSELGIAVISGVIGAVSGSFSGGIIAWMVAPTQAEREERGRQRMESRRAIAAAVARLEYQMTEARGRLFRIESVENLLNQTQFVAFAGAVKSNADSLPHLERWRVTRQAKALVGRLAWRLAALVPSDHYADIDEASVLKATADTRTSLEVPLCGTALATLRPSDSKWDAALKAVSKLRKSYPA